MISHHDVLAFIEYEKHFRMRAADENAGSSRNSEENGVFANLPMPEQALIILASLHSLRR